MMTGKGGMSLFNKVVAVVISIAFVAALISWSLPRYATVTRSVEVAAPAEAVFPVVSDLRRYNEWSPWLEKDPQTKLTFTGPVDGVGQTMNWESANDDVGTGKQSITRIDPGKEVETAVEFGDQDPATATVKLEPSGDKTKVTWGFSTDLGYNPISRYMGLMFDGWVGPDYERGLAKLKTLVETPKSATPPADDPQASGAGAQ
jgi:carbon monoxide dehydrogenase subunit G